MSHFRQKNIIKLPEDILNNFKSKQYTYIASFDIGVKNFCFYIEEVEIDKINNVKNIPKCKRYNSDGTSTEDFKALLRDIYSNGRNILHLNNDITSECDEKVYMDPKVFHNLTELLDRYIEYWDICSHFVIEQQMAFVNTAKNFYKNKFARYKNTNPTKINTRAIKVAQHLMSYLIITYSDTKNIYDFPSYHKTQILGATKGMGDRERKKWSPDICIGIFDLRGDKKNISKLINSKKKDDLADVVLQCQAFKYLHYIDKKL